MERLISLFGLFCMIAIAFGLSTDRSKINWRTVISGIVIQMLLGLIILKTDLGMNLAAGAKDFFKGILDFTNEGSWFLFGKLADFPAMASIADPSKRGPFVFAFMVLPTIIFMSALMSVLYHVGAMQVIVKTTAWIMMKVMRTSGAESLSAAANIFVGQTEAPLVVKPFIGKMTKSELMALMTGGMATVAGGVLAAYVGFGIDAGHLLVASFMSAPAALVCAKLMVPETEESTTAGTVKLEMPKTSVNVVEAAATGAADGLKLALNVGAMLLAFVALIALLNGGIAAVGGWFGYPQLSMDIILGYLFAPFAFVMGVPWSEAALVGALLGKKVVVNEFIAYIDLAAIKSQLSPRSITITTYALCGFANFSSIAIQIGGIGTLAPERKTDLAKLGIKCLIGGTLACFMTACIAGFLL
jgi:concentrative nucleoside transporter, CNT family